MTIAASARVVAAVLARPRLWPVALRQWRRTTPAGWWRRRPYLPVPSRAYLEFRMVTQYGDAMHAMTPADVLNYLAWCARYDRAGETHA